jgi:hypothetical protein
MFQMRKEILPVVICGIVLLMLSLIMFFASAYILPAVTQEYLSSVFRTSGTNDWLYYTHPFVLSIALKWLWERYKNIFKGSVVLRAAEVAMVYCILAMVPLLWLTFSVIDVSLIMVLTWLLYGLVQAFAAGIVFAKLNP